MSAAENPRRAGRYTTGGAIGGPTTSIDLRDLIYKDLELHGITNPTPRRSLARLVSLIESRQLQPLLEATYPLADLADAQSALRKRAHVGKYVVVP